jgi:hypothetical protein
VRSSRSPVIAPASSVITPQTAEAREETAQRFVHEALSGPSTFRNYTHSEPRFRALLTEGASEVKLALV